MTQLLIRTFIKEPQQVKKPAVRTDYGNLASGVGIACNLLLCLGKVGVGLLCGSVAIAADGLNNLSDASSNVISLLGFRLSSKAPDEKHPYGHARFEYLATLGVSVVILAIGLSLLWESLKKMIHPEHPEFRLVSVGILLASIAVKLWMGRFNRLIGERIQSDTLRAAAVDSRNDVISTSAVLISAIGCSVTGIDRIDGIAGGAVAVFILWSGWGLVRNTLSTILGESPDPELVRHIEEKVMSYPGVLGTHDFMLHDYGPGRQFASLHVELPAEMSSLEAHTRIDRIEQDFLRDDKIQLTIHFDPIVTADERVSALRTTVGQKAKEIDPRLSIHDLRIVPCSNHTNVLFDLVLPAGYASKQASVVQSLRQCVHDLDESYVCVVKIEQSYIARQ